MHLHLYLDDYVTAMGAVGLLRLIDYVKDNQRLSQSDIDEMISIEEDHLRVNPNILPRIPEWYFHYLLHEYSIFRRETKKLNYSFQSRRPFSGKLKDLKENMKSNAAKLKKYFSETAEYQKLEQIINEVNSSEMNNEEQLHHYKEKYLNLLSTTMFDERMTLNYVRTVVLQPFFGQASFLQKTFSSKSLAEHISRVQKDYVDPVIRDLKLMQLLSNNQIEKNDVIELLDQYNHPIYNRWKREIKKLKDENVNEYFRQQPHCLLFDEWIAASNFEEMVYVPLGISINNAYNFAWDLQDKQPAPLSSWGRLVLFLSPIGVTPYTIKKGSEYETFNCFIYRDGTPQIIYQDNNLIRNLEQNEAFDKLIPKLAERAKHKSKQAAKADIQIVEFYSNYDAKKTVMHYYHIPRYVIQYFDEDDAAKLEYIGDRFLRDDFLRLTLDNIDPVSVIWTYMREAIKSGRSSQPMYQAFIERWKLQNLKKGERAMKNAGLIKSIFREGRQVRAQMYASANKRKEEADYASGGDKRVAGIAYRLLNAAKSGDRQQFLDTAMRLYLQVGLPLPTLFLNVLHEENLDFQTVSGAFISGLLAKDYSDASSSNEKNEMDETVHS